MWRWTTVLCVFGVAAGSAMKPEYDVIVVGMGPAGSMAAATLAQAGRRVLALEADARVGGRVRTVPFGDGIIELGAEWIHGTENSLVYDMAIQNNVTLRSQSVEFKVFRSDGSEADSKVVNDLLTFSMEVLETPPAEPESTGHYITRRVNEYVEKKYPHLSNDSDFMENFFHLMELMVNNYEASDSWRDVSTASSYHELGGDQHMSWHAHGYRTLFDILLKQYKNGPGLPSLTVKLNAEVVLIKWPKLSSGPVQVITKDGTVYEAQSVIVTVSLGVLKERHASLFSPPLPSEKLRAIELVSFGVVGKVVLRFPTQICHSTVCAFMWNTADKLALSNTDRWLAFTELLSVPMACPTCVSVWLSGDRAKLVETLDDDVVQSKVMEVVRRFMGAALPDPVQMIRSSWFSNPWTRGSYSYDNTLSPQCPGARDTLGAPLRDAAGRARVLFAGEATNPTHFSTVHGALETGAREAARILTLPIPSPLSAHSKL